MLELFVLPLLAMQGLVQFLDQGMARRKVFWK
jgi:hypothetical protein